MSTLVKQRLIDEIKNGDNIVNLVQFFELWQQLKNFSPLSQSPINLFSGCLNDDDAEEIRQIVKAEFNHIEGEW